MSVMKTVQFARKQVPAIGMGTWYMGEQPAIYKQELEALRTGIESGLTLIDTAEMYGEGLAEKLVGEAIAPYDREQLTIVTKVYPWNATTTGVRQSLENSLKRLGTDYVDMYLLHWLGDVPLEETVAIFETLQTEGKIKAWGVSNFDVPDMACLEKLSPNCMTNQVLYHMASRGIDFELRPWMQQRAIPVMAYSPLGHGDTLNTNFAQNELLQQMAQSYNITIQQLLLAWVVAQEQTIAIPKASRKEHVLANRAALDVVLNIEHLTQLDAMYPKPITKQPLDEL